MRSLLDVGTILAPSAAVAERFKSAAEMAKATTLQRYPPRSVCAAVTAKRASAAAG